MVVDPEFSDAGKGKPRTGRSWLRWLVVYPVLGLAGCHMLLTGSPVPLWYRERLDHPVAVKDVSDQVLVLADGQSVALPFIKRLPRTDPVFLRALRHGVEVGKGGEVLGLITFYPFCGNDPFRWYTKRINLSELAGFMDPDAIDDAIVDPEDIRWLRENESRTLDHHGLPYLLVNRVSRVRQIFEASRRKTNEEPNVIRSYSREQIDQ
jgi:hypothetical protein